jgi:phosphatidate cytidylyltransferase
MLKLRVITAILMLAVLLPAVFYPAPQAFAAIALVLVGVAAWEWAKLNQLAPLFALAFGAVCAVFCLFTWYAGWFTRPLRLLWFFVGSGWVIGGAWLLYAGAPGWLVIPQWLRLLTGMVALWAAWLAVVQARIMGVNFLFSVLALVWLADIVAYASGRLLGGKLFQRKLAPTISPGKTWEGAVGGMIGVVLLAMVWQVLDFRNLPEQSSLYTRLGSGGLVFLLVAMVFLGAMSVVGDLVESLIKRSVGVKDSSALLPGHGGVLDRIDALLPVLPLTMMLCTI